MAFGKKERPTVDKDGAALVMRKRDYLADFSGQLGLGLMANLVGQLQYFYTDKVGLAVGSVGVVMVIAKVVDALTDIWFGNIIDHSKGGNMKYYKWMLRMAVPAAVITVMMFTVPIQAGQIPAGRSQKSFVLYRYDVGRNQQLPLLFEPELFSERIQKRIWCYPDAISQATPYRIMIFCCF